MGSKKSQQPVKPLSGEHVQPAGVWSLERFSERAQRQADEQTQQLLDEMRAALRPKLEAELAQIRAQAQASGREAGYQAGYAAGEKAGYEAGYQAGMAAAEEELQRLKEAAGALLDALKQPLAAWDEALMQQVSRIIRESLSRFLVADVAARIELMRTQLLAVLRQMQADSAPIVITAHPDTIERLKPLLEVEVAWQADPDAPPTQVRVHQDVAEIVVDWQQQLEHYLNSLEQALQASCDDAPSDTATDSTA